MMRGLLDPFFVSVGMLLGWRNSRVMAISGRPIVVVVTGDQVVTNLDPVPALNEL